MMKIEIETDFDIDDEVYYVDNGRIQKDMIVGYKIDVNRAGNSKVRYQLASYTHFLDEVFASPEKAAENLVNKFKAVRRAE